MGYKSIGRQIQLAREQAGYNQEQLAAKIGCSQSTLSNYEKGKRRVYLAQLQKIAEVLHKPVDYFLQPEEYFGDDWDKQDDGHQIIDVHPHEVNKITHTPTLQKAAAVSVEEQTLLLSYRSLSEEEKKLALDFVIWLKNREVAKNG